MSIDFNRTDLSGVMTCADASVTDAACGSGFEVNPDSRELRQLTFAPGPEFPALCEGSSFETRVADAPYDACVNETITEEECKNVQGVNNPPCWWDAEDQLQLGNSFTATKTWNCRVPYQLLKIQLVSTCNLTVGSFDHLTCCQPAPPSWRRVRGCCREVGPGKGKHGENHHDTVSAVKMYRKASSRSALKKCKAACADSPDCTAIEIFRKGKKKNKAFRCELHTAGINGATRKSKSCKKATCHMIAPGY